MFNKAKFIEDCEILKQALDKIKFYRGTERRTGAFKHAKCNDKDGGSMLFGTTWKGFLKYDKEGNMVKRTPADVKGLYYTKCRDLYPELGLVLQDFADKYLGDFEYTQCQLNKNFQSPPHFDSKNMGESYIVGLGDYTGGRLHIKQPSSFGGMLTRKEDIKNRLLCFNGSKYEHWVEDYTGTRYSVVFFNNNKKSKLRKNKSLSDIAEEDSKDSNDSNFTNSENPMEK